jgi:hypothetical protein
MVSGRTVSIIFGSAIVLLGCFHIGCGIVAQLGGHGFWGGRGFIFDAEDDGDPVGFRTVVWGNMASGVFEVVVGSYLILTLR